jgi:hypothetical protein
LASRELGAQCRMTSAYNLGNVGLVSKILRILELMDCSGGGRQASRRLSARRKFALAVGWRRSLRPLAALAPGSKPGDYRKTGAFGMTAVLELRVLGDVVASSHFCAGRFLSKG